MKAFYDKYAKLLGANVAYKLIKAEVCKAVEAEDKGGDPLHHLSIAHEMIDDLFEVIGQGKPEAYRA